MQLHGKLTTPKHYLNTRVSTMAKTTYIDSLTSLRGIAALWVVLFHIDVSIFYRDLGGLVPRDATGIFAKGYLWVDFFFLLSGFIIAHVYGAQLAGANKPHNIKNYLWARFSRLYPLHIFTLLVLVVFALLVPEFYPNVVDGSWKTYFAWSAIPSNLLFTNAMNQHVYLSWNMVSWSIGAEWWTYVAAIGLIIATHKRALWQVGGLMLAAFSALVFLVLQLPEKNLDITFNYGFFRCLFEFTIGLGLYEFYRQKIGRQWLASDLVPAILLAMIISIFHWRLADLIIIPVFSLLILAAAHNHNRLHRLLNQRVFIYLGDISYSIYLVHCLWFMVFWFSFPALKASTGMAQMPGWMRIAYVVLFLALTLLSAHFTHRYIEVGGREYLRKLFNKKPTTIMTPTEETL